MTIDTKQTEDTGRAARLRLETRSTHERLDNSIMTLEPFASRVNYVRFLQIQHAFHAMIDPLYADPWFGRVLPDLSVRSRLAAIEADLADLDVMPAAASARAIGPIEGLGWLYVAEGSNLGAAFLLKAAREALGLSEDFGARHLAAHPDGRGLQWRRFTAALDALPLEHDGQETEVIEGARQAFAFVQSSVDRQRSLTA